MKKVILFYLHIMAALLLLLLVSNVQPQSLRAQEPDLSVSERIAVTKPIKMKRYASPEEIEVPIGASFSILDYGGERNKVRLFDSMGGEISGLYEISTKDLQDYVHLQNMGDDLDEIKSPAIPKAEPMHPEPEDDTSENGLVAGEDFPLLPEGDMGEYMPKSIIVDFTFSPSTDICVFYKNFIAKGVPKIPLKQALFYYTKHLDDFSNKRWVSIADYSQRSTRRRFYLLDLQSGSVQMEKVSHGSGTIGGGRSRRHRSSKRKSRARRRADISIVSRGLASANADPDRDGVLDRCSQPGISSGPLKDKNMTRVGFFKTLGLDYSPDHRSKWPWLARGKNKLLIRGLSPTNQEAEADGVVMHEAYYNRDGDAVMGMSWGCPAFVPGRGAPIIRKIEQGSLFYGYAPVCAAEMREVKAQIAGWESFCAQEDNTGEEDHGDVSSEKEAPADTSAGSSASSSGDPAVALPDHYSVPKKKPSVAQKKVKKAVRKKAAKKRRPASDSAQWEP